MKTTSTCRRRSRARREGAILVLVTLLLVFVIAMVAFSVDIGYLADTKGRLRAAADAGALAAAGALVESYSLDDTRQVALNYVQANVPSSYGNVADNSSVTFGTWNPATRTFTPTNTGPNAIRVVVSRTAARGNSVGMFFARVLGINEADLTVEAIAVGAVPSSIDTSSANSVYVTSTKDLSNVVVEFADGTHQKFEPLSGYTGTFSGTGENAGKQIVGVWIKSGCNHSDDGPGYGEYIAYEDPQYATTVHGQNEAHGCTPHVTASFESSGVTFQESGAASPVRLVK